MRTGNDDVMAEDKGLALQWEMTNGEEDMKPNTYPPTMRWANCMSCDLLIGYHPGHLNRRQTDGQTHRQTRTHAHM